MGLLLCLRCDAGIGIHTVQQLAVHVQLLLSAGCVADANWFRSPVAVQVSENALRLHALAANSIQDLHLVYRTLGSVFQEMKETMRLAETSVMHKRGYDELRVSQPRKPIIPIPLPGDCFRKRRGRRGYDRTGRREGEELQQ